MAQSFFIYGKKGIISKQGRSMVLRPCHDYD